MTSKIQIFSCLFVSGRKIEKFVLAATLRYMPRTLGAELLETTPTEKTTPISKHLRFQKNSLRTI